MTPPPVFGVDITFLQSNLVFEQLTLLLQQITYAENPF